MAVLDRTVTPMGSRWLADWIANPLTDLSAIDERLDGVAELVGDARLTEDIQQKLRGIYDLERLLARVTTGRATPRDLAAVGKTLSALPAIKARLTARKSELLARLEGALDLCGEIRAKLERGLADDCGLASREGGFIRAGFHADLDALRELASGGKQWIAQYQADEIARTGIASLKVGFNKVFGYYLEVTHTHGHKIPDHYIRKQTVKNAERYITPELKEYEEKVLSADEKAKELEYRLFVEMRDATAACAKRLQTTAAVLAQLDVLASLAASGAAARLLPPEMRRRADSANRRRSAPGARHPRGGRFVRPQRHAVRRRAGRDPPDHRPEHGGQEHLHPAGRSLDAVGADRQLRSGPQSDARRGGPHLCPRRRERRTLARGKARSWSR